MVPLRGHFKNLRRAPPSDFIMGVPPNSRLMQNIANACSNVCTLEHNYVKVATHLVGRSRAYERALGIG